VKNPFSIEIFEKPGKKEEKVFDEGEILKEKVDSNRMKEKQRKGG